MSISPLLNIPDPVLCDILCSWLSVCALTRLDSALCSKNARSHTLALLTSTGCLLRSTVEEQEFLYDKGALVDMFRWAADRDFRLDGMMLTSATSLEVAFTTLGEHVEWVIDRLPYNLGADHAAARPVAVSLCSNLRRLCLYSGLDNQCMVEVVASHCPRLEFLDFPEGCLTSMDADLFLLLSKGCPRLQYLGMGFTEELTEEGLLAGLANLPCLTYLRHRPVATLDNASLRAIGQMCPLLSTFITYSYALPSDSAVLSYARCFPRLTSLGLLSAAWSLTISGACYMELFRLCPCMTKWEIPASIDVDQVARVLGAHKQLTQISVTIGDSSAVLDVIAHHCPQLQKLSIQSNECGDRLDEALFSVASNLPNLTKLVFLSHKTMTTDGIIAFAKRCPKLHRLEFQCIDSDVDMERLRSETSLYICAREDRSWLRMDTFDNKQ